VPQLGWHASLEELIGGRGAIASAASQVSHFVFHLDHQNGLLVRVRIPNMAHQGGKGPGITAKGLLTERGEDLQRQALGRNRPRKSSRVGSDPLGRIVGERIFPASEPEQHQVKMLPSRHSHPVIQEGKVERTFFRFDVLPGNRHQHRIEMHPRQLGENVVGLSGRTAEEFPSSPPRMRKGLP
jgi:hypothetical protein